MQLFVIKSRTYGNVEFTCGGNLSNMRVSCATLGWTLVTACDGGAVSAGAPVYTDETTLQRAAKKWWRQAKPLLDAHVRPQPGDLRIDLVQWVYVGASKSYAICTVREFGNGWVFAGAWQVPLHVASEGRPAMLAYIKDRMTAQADKEAA